MSDIFVSGCGVVSPAGWGIESFRQALTKGRALPTVQIDRPGWEHSLSVRKVPRLMPAPDFMRHARLRRSSAIAQHAVGAALEAVGVDAKTLSGGERLGVVFCAMSGCVNYSRRFYDETLKDPATASPLVFPETVFNAPASHLAALLGTTAVNYTLVGDPGTFLQGLAVAANWLTQDEVDGCLVIGAEEMDWLTADAFRHFNRSMIMADGAGALYLRREANRIPAAKIEAITEPHIYSKRQTRAQAALAARKELHFSSTEALLVGSRQDLPRLDEPEINAWRDWPGSQLHPRKILGEGLMAGAAWQCVAAVDALQERRFASAVVSVVGNNQQAIAARFVAAHR